MASERKSEQKSGKPQTDGLPPLPSTTDQPDQQPEPQGNTQADDPGVAEIRQAGEATVALTCTVCGLVNRPGELACSRCGTVLATGGNTKKFGVQDDPPKPTTWPTGEVIVTDQEPIILEIGDVQITVPLAEVITVGRVSEIPDDVPPDVDLSGYGGGDLGVSRKHLKIKRKNILVYVTDLGSTNGTLLNGRKLIPNADRLLRNGDELQLGRLKLTVKF